ncbi:MAG: hypothetical protein ACOYNS_02930 [Bacteroidota bacterium]
MSIIEINNQLIRYNDAEGNEQQVNLRDVSSVLHQAETGADRSDHLYLRNGNVLAGTVSSLEYDRVILISSSGDTTTHDPSAVLKVTGKQSAFSFHSMDDKYFFLTGANITFVGGRPTRPLTQSQYRFIFSAYASLPASSFTYQFPGLLNENVRTGYGISFTIDYSLAPGNDLSFSYRFTENSIGTPDSLPGPFSEWSNHLLLAGIKRTITIAHPMRIYGEAKAGYAVAMPPEHHDLSPEQSSGAAWSIGGGIYLTENISVDLVYLSFSPDVRMTYSRPNSLSTRIITQQQDVSAFLAGISYTFGSGN